MNVHSSRSARRIPTLVFPAPMNPTRYTFPLFMSVLESFKQDPEALPVIDRFTGILFALEARSQKQEAKSNGVQAFHRSLSAPGFSYPASLLGGIPRTSATTARDHHFGDASGIRTRQSPPEPPRIPESLHRHTLLRESSFLRPRPFRRSRRPWRCDGRRGNRCPSRVNTGRRQV